MIDTGSRPSAVNYWYKFPTYNKLFTERSSKIYEDLHCNFGSGDEIFKNSPQTFPTSISASRYFWGNIFRWTHWKCANWVSYSNSFENEQQWIAAVFVSASIRGIFNVYSEFIFIAINAFLKCRLCKTQMWFVLYVNVHFE